MEKSLLVIGAGGLATEIEELARLQRYDRIAFLDDHPDVGRCVPIVGRIADAESFRDSYDHAIVALGNNRSRLYFTEQLLMYGYEVPVLIHPTAWVSPDSELGPGCIIRQHAVVCRSVRLGKACLINVGGLIDHDCVLGEGTHVLMGAVVRNEVSVPPLTWIDANQVVQ